MTEKTYEAYSPAFFGKTPPERRFDPVVAIAFGYDPRARQPNSRCVEVRSMPGLMMCPQCRRRSTGRFSTSLAANSLPKRFCAAAPCFALRAIVQRIGRYDQAVEPLDHQDCRFEEARFVFVHGLAYVDRSRGSGLFGSWVCPRRMFQNARSAWSSPDFSTSSTPPSHRRSAPPSPATSGRLRGNFSISAMRAASPILSQCGRAQRSPLLPALLIRR